MRHLPQHSFRLRRGLAFGLLLCCGLPARGAPDVPAIPERGALVLWTNAQVASEGIFLNQIANGEFSASKIKLADAPAFGRWLTLTRRQVTELLQARAPALAATNWAGAQQVRVTRRARILGEAELKTLLTTPLQRDHVRDRGELELKLPRPWTPLSVPDEPLVLKFLDLPNAGVSASFIARFELSAGREALGTWQLPLQAKIWRELWVARTELARGALLQPADLERERQDVLPLRDLLPENFEDNGPLELAEHVPLGAPLYTRSVRLKPLIRRGQVVEALLQEGALTISLKVEALESGAAGQVVRVRNPQSRREFRGKVQNEQTILVSL
jgi:flagella basal body P-ring formation protein FlgA